VRTIGVEETASSKDNGLDEVLSQIKSEVEEIEHCIQGVNDNLITVASADLIDQAWQRMQLLGDKIPEWMMDKELRSSKKSYNYYTSQKYVITLKSSGRYYSESNHFSIQRYHCIQRDVKRFKELLSEEETIQGLTKADRLIYWRVRGIRELAFVKEALQQKPVDSEIMTTNVSSVYSFLENELARAQGVLPFVVVDALKIDLSATCPQCGKKLSGIALGMFDDSLFLKEHLEHFCHSDRLVLSYRPRHRLFTEEKNVEALLTVLTKDTFWFARKKAAEALGCMRDTRAVEPLIAALKDKNENVRWKAVKALGEIGDDRAIEPLEALLDLKGEYEIVQMEAKQALRILKHT
jgi:hypothetical protein